MEKLHDEEGRPMMERRNFYLPKPLAKDLETLAKKKGLSMSELLRAALAQYLEQQG